MLAQEWLSLGTGGEGLSYLDFDGGRWRLLFDWDQMMEVQEGGVGDWWAD